MAETKKKKYEVILDFTDLEDNNKVYTNGKPYPQPANKKVSPERIAQLLNHPNGNSYIKEVEE